MGKKVAIILSGCGYLDGSEIHEATLLMLHCEKQGFTYQCYAPDIPQSTTISHLAKDQMATPRRVLDEAARLARSAITPLHDINPKAYKACIFPGGFGAASSLCSFATKQTALEILPELEHVIDAFHSASKPLLAACIAPVIPVKYFLNKEKIPKFTLGPKEEPNLWFSEEKCSGELCRADQCCIDQSLKLITTPAYMDEKATISTVDKGIAKAVAAMTTLL